MKTTPHLPVVRCRGSLRRCSRLAAAFIPPTRDTPLLKLLYFVIDIALLFSLIGIHAAECERLGFFGRRRRAVRQSAPRVTGVIVAHRRARDVLGSPVNLT